MSKQKYWIADPNTGVKAVVEGAAERDRWVQVQGWSETDGPAPSDRVWVHNAQTDGRAAMTHEAALGLWAGLGWTLSAPPEPLDLTKAPARVDQPPQTTRTASAAAATTSATTKEN